ncbi:STAS domain-containing protein [Tundrisphaera lichenicola]|uniref:STAS domain-containing protein n=1 Tax=Tundrisphaera lichenicola TaxID=2029860 RepID=UPI003EB7EDE5
MRPPLVHEEGDVLLISLDDPIAVNEGQAHGLRKLLYEPIESRDSPKVAIDLGGIDYLSSTGIALVIGLKRRVEAREGRLVLFQLRPEILDLFSVMKLTTLFTILPDQEQALDLLRSPVAD